MSATLPESTTAEPDYQDTDNEIAVGVPMFMRDEALHRLLNSVPEYVSTVYIAENGEEQDRALYHDEWPFELDVLRLPVDCGIGHCRAALTNAVEETYIWIGDSDMEFVRDEDLRTLRTVLERNPDLGGVAGWLIEGDVVRAGARDLLVEEETIIKTAANPEIEGDEIPFARFDFIPQAALFRTAVFEDYDYDPRMQSSEHVDFFYGHRQRTDWDFASTPTVMIQHNRQINQEYRQSERGGNHVDLDLLEGKWGVRNTVPGDRPDWGFVRGRPLHEQAFDVFRRATPPRVWLPVKRTLEGMIRD